MKEIIQNLNCIHDADNNNLGTYKWKGYNYDTYETELECMICGKIVYKTILGIESDEPGEPI
jgi:hypothetical protein